MIELDPAMDSLREQRSHHHARLWHMTREDGTEYFFTDFSVSIDYGGNTYQPISIMSTSAVESSEGIRERNRSFLGYLSSTELTEDDLRAGLFNNTQVVERQVDWRYPWQGTFHEDTYFITELKWTGEKWEAELDGLTTKLRQYKGITMARRCRFELFDSNCGLTAATYEETGSVSAVTTQRRVIQTDKTVKVDGYYSEGKIEFTSGANNGFTYKISTSVQTGGVITLLVPAKYDIAPADTFKIWPGCNKTANHCKGNNNRPWSSNFANFGAFPHIPGPTNALQTPNSK